MKAEMQSGNPLRIWLVTIGEPLPIGLGALDRLLRVGSLAQLLAKLGHEVVWWTSTFDHSRKSHHFSEDAVSEVADRLTLRLIHGCGYENNLSLKRILDQRQIAGKFSAMAQREERKPDIILASLPTIDLSLAAVRYGRKNGVPVVLDMRDMWPDIFIEAVPAFLRPLARIPLRSMYRDARTACAGATAITGITEEFVSWGLKRGGRPRTVLDRAFPMAYVSSPPADEQIQSAELYWDGLGVLKEDATRTLCFMGALSSQFDIETVLLAAAQCSRRNLPWRFVLCGTGDRLAVYKEKAQGLENVVFPGWVDRAQIHVLMRRSAAGLDPLPDRYDFLATINNKAIEYMSAGLPVISCPKRGVLAELLAAERCGWSYDYGDVEGLVNLLASITPGALREFSVNSTSLFRERFTAEKVYGEMARYLEKIVQNFKSPAVPGKS